MPPEESPSPAPKGASVRWRRWIVSAALVLAFVVLTIALVVRFCGYDIAKQWVESPAGPRVAGRELGKAIKVDGTFAPIHLNGWLIETDSFTSQGWPGEAIGSLDAYDIRAEFDLSAVMHRAWRFSSIQIDHAVIRLLQPDDALKRPPGPKKPKPWYAVFLPDHFECGPIVSQKSEIRFVFQGIDSGIRDAHVQADLIGKNLKYTATSGVLDFPYLPPLRIERLEMFVTRPAITIYTAQLAGIDPGDPARLVLSGRIGMREDKSIDANVEVNEMSIENILPENLRPLIHGKISGKLTWRRNTAGDDIESEGDLKLTGASIDKLSVFKELTDLHSNPDLQDFTFDEATCHFRRQSGRLTLDLDASVAGKFHMTGTVNYDVKSKVTDLDLVFDQLPLKVWLPSEFKPRYSGMAKASLKWHGQLDTRKDSTATIAVNLDGTHISDPVLLRRFLSAHGFRAPDDIQLDKAQFNFSYQDEIFKLTRAELVAPGVLNAQLSGKLEHKNDLTAAMDWQGLILRDWLPAGLAKQLSGNLDGHVSLAVRKWQFGDGSYGGDVRLLNGELTYTSIQSVLARFLNERALLDMPLTRTQLSWTWDHGNLAAKGIDIRAADDFGVKGDLAVSDSKQLSGVLWVGTKPENLKWLPNAEKTVFTRNEEGLVWAKVTLSGTSKKPGQDLSAQIMKQLTRHPLALAGLGVKAVSWYMGNWFGAEKEWKRPEEPNVEVSAAPTPVKAE
ncbi:MAG: hypothetical protein LV480_03135 [Methylacidiphilales bacterium]|nr:hypothetical protein [Candidatus Methylacidiphilales bacterium]